MRTLWSLPVMALLVLLARPFNDQFYELVVNYDPQGDAQQHEWVYTTGIFQHTSGFLCGQLLAVVAGIVLGRRHPWPAAVRRALGIGVLLAAVAFAVAVPLALTGRQPAPFGDPVLVRVLLCELAAVPLLAAAGAGLATVARGRVLGPLVALAGVGWCVGTVIGLLQDNRLSWPLWLLWTVPPVAAAATIALAGLSVDVWSDPSVVVGDWGRGSSIALLAGVSAYALGVNLWAAWVNAAAGTARGRPGRGSNPLRAPDGSAHRCGR
jgi:hypothetical protein